MQQPHAHEGDEAPHVHPVGPPPRPLNPDDVIRVESEVPGPPPGFEPMPPIGERAIDPTNEATAAGAQQWLAREFVGGLVAMAQQLNVPVGDFLVDKAILMATRLASAESLVQVQQTQLQALAHENASLRAQVEDCGCHDEDPVVQAVVDAVFPQMGGNGSVIKNGDGHG